MTKEEIELLCKYKKCKYISHKTGDDGVSIYITIETEIRTTPREIEPYINQQKLIDAKK